MSDALDELARLAEASGRTVVLTGAGLSTESGLPDYRGPDGLWRNRRFEELASLSTWRERPAELWAFYGERLRALAAAAPNPGHVALAELERLAYVQLLVTQNVDGLHRAAGSRRVVEAHGSLAEVECLACGWRGPSEEAHAQLDAGRAVPLCQQCDEPLKPAVVLFGERLAADFHLVVRDVEECDLLLCCGTSLQVPPVALLPSHALRGGAELAVVNLGPTSCDEAARVRVEGRTGEVLPALLARLTGTSR